MEIVIPWIVHQSLGHVHRALITFVLMFTVHAEIKLMILQMDMIAHAWPNIDSLAKPLLTSIYESVFASYCSMRMQLLIALLYKPSSIFIYYASFERVIIIFLNMIEFQLQSPANLVDLKFILSYDLLRPRSDGASFNFQSWIENLFLSESFNNMKCDLKTIQPVCLS